MLSANKILPIKLYKSILSILLLRMELKKRGHKNLVAVRAGVRSGLPLQTLVLKNSEREEGPGVFLL